MSVCVLAFARAMAIFAALFMAKKTIRDISLTGKRVLVRVDFNVPLEEQGGQMVITDDTRIRETLPTLRVLAEGAPSKPNAPRLAVTRVRS